MIKNSKKDREKRYFEMFEKVYPLPPGERIHDDKPDFRIENEKVLGIEMTNFYFEDGIRPESEQVQIRLRDKIVSKSQAQYLNDGGSNIGITFGFDKQSPIQDEGKLVNDLVDLAKRVENLETGEVPRKIFSMIPELDFVYLNVQHAIWRVQQVYRGQGMSMDRLLQIVRDKEGKVNGYERCDAYWLLVVVDFFDMAQDQEIRIVGFEKIKSDIFDKIIIFKTITNEILEAK